MMIALLIGAIVAIGCVIVALGLWIVAVIMNTKWD